VARRSARGGLRFHIPLIKPDMRTPRIRLSDKVVTRFAHGKLRVRDVIRFTTVLCVESIEFVENVIGCAVILEIAPYLLHRVELRGVGREPLDRKPRIDSPPVLHPCATMGVKPIPDKDDVALKTAEQIALE